MGDLVKAMAPTAKDLAKTAAIETGKYGVNKISQKLGLNPPKRKRKGRRPRRSGVKKRRRRTQNGGIVPFLAALALRMRKKR